MMIPPHARSLVEAIQLGILINITVALVFLAIGGRYFIIRRDRKQLLRLSGIMLFVILYAITYHRYNAFEATQINWWLGWGSTGSTIPLVIENVAQMAHISKSHLERKAFLGFRMFVYFVAIGTSTVVMISFYELIISINNL